MSKGELEVLLVDAEGLAGADVIGELLVAALTQTQATSFSTSFKLDPVTDMRLISTGKIDPYVVIQYRDQERQSRIARSKHHSPKLSRILLYQGRNPIWNQTLKFPVYSSGINNHIQHKLTLRIMDYDTITADDFVGQATIHVGEVIALGTEKGIAELPPTKYRVVLEDKRYHGAIRVGVRFRTK
ncbi:hypothetical protein BHM03_00043167, partial [Ensete ventricosum]